jgi:DNA topoisomerase IA
MTSLLIISMKFLITDLQLVEEAFDIIAEGNRAWKDVMTEFYGNSTQELKM